MKLKSAVIGALLYLGLFAVASFFLLYLGRMWLPPFPSWYGMAVFHTFIFCGAFLFKTLETGSLKQLSVGLLVFYLSYTLWFWISSWSCPRVPISVSMCHIPSAYFVVMWLVATAGLLVARWAQSIWTSAKARYIRIWLAPVAFAMLCFGGLYEFGIVAMYSGVRASALTVSDLKCNADDLSATKVVPELQAPIAGGTNLIWCAPFQLAWNEMADLIGEDICFKEGDPVCVPHLNQRLIGKGNLDPETYVTVAGPYTRDLISKMNADIRSLFGAGSFTPEPLPETDDQGRLAAFGYLTINLPFKHAFQRTDRPLMFNGVPVKAFTIPFGDGSFLMEEYARQQVQVFYPPQKGTFIVELKTKQTGHQLILAKVSPEATLTKTVEKVSDYIDTMPQEPLETNQDLIVPLFNFDIIRKYTELIGRTLAVENPAYRGWLIDKAEQNIRFQLDERGAVLRSDASMSAVFGGPPMPCIFDRPFLLMLRYKDSPVPYFVMWVDNAEILVKSE